MHSLTPHLLSQTQFATLFALSLKPRHGYELLKQIELDSLSKIQLGPGALYGALGQLAEGNFIEEIPSEVEHDRRRQYRLTKKGWDLLQAELAYYRNVVALAKERTL